MLLPLLFISPLFAEEDRAPVFTNEDLKKQNRPGDGDSGITPKASETSKEMKPASKKPSGDAGKERWCRKATGLRGRIDSAKAHLSAEEKKRADAEAGIPIRSSKKFTPKKEPSAAGVRKARIKLESAEKDLSRLEQEAHRRNIPPGWLRCQFSY
jgi:hypothetical protein